MYTHIYIYRYTAAASIREYISEGGDYYCLPKLRLWCCICYVHTLLFFSSFVHCSLQYVQFFIAMAIYYLFRHLQPLVLSDPYCLRDHYMTKNITIPFSDTHFLRCLWEKNLTRQLPNQYWFEHHRRTKSSPHPNKR